MIRGATGLVVGASLALAVLSCKGDKQESLQVPNPLAVDAYGEMYFGDACGRLDDLCLQETVQSIDSFSVDPPGTLEVLPASTISPELLSLWGFSGAYVVHGLAPGVANVCVDAHYSDGTDRNACQLVTVAAIAHVVTSLECDTSVGGIQAGPLVPSGYTLCFNVGLLAADGSQLDGVFLHPIDDGPFIPVSALHYKWESGPGDALAIGSPLDPTFSQTFATYDVAQVTRVAAGTDLTPPTILGPGQQESIQVALDVGSVRACVGLPVTAKTETPDVCLGPNGELAWSETAGSTTSFTAVTEGTCQLSVGVVGGSGYPATVAVPFYVPNPRDKGRDSSVGDDCTTVSFQTCDVARDAILVCTSAHKWALASSCNGALCDYTAPAAGCTAAHGCVACR